MNNLENFHWKMAPYEIPILLLVLWDLTWKVIAMWKSARNKQIIWFICIALLNTLGILPIIYLITGKKKKIVME